MHIRLGLISAAILTELTPVGYRGELQKYILCPRLIPFCSEFDAYIKSNLKP